MEQNWNGYLRADGRKGIRNRVLVIYTVECASFVAKEIVRRADHLDVEAIGCGLRGAADPGVPGPGAVPKLGRHRPQERGPGGEAGVSPGRGVCYLLDRNIKGGGKLPPP